MIVRSGRRSKLYGLAAASMLALASAILFQGSKTDAALMATEAVVGSDIAVLSLTGTAPLTPTLKWTYVPTTPTSTHNQVVCMPVVGDVNLDDVPDVVFSTFEREENGWYQDGVLRVVSGDDGDEVFSVTDPSLRVRPLSSPLIADLDNDGSPEIVVEGEEGGFYAFDNGGDLKHSSVPTFTLHPDEGSMPAVADLDGDGCPEIVVGRHVLDHTLSQVTTLGDGSDRLLSSIVGDVNLDGNLEVIAGNTIYSGTGGILFHNSSLPAQGTNALGNFDADSYPEIVLVDPFHGGQVYLLDHQMKDVIWGPVPVPASGGIDYANGGPPTVADLDGDGWPEIGIAGQYSYVVLDTDGTKLWQSPTQDHSSGFTGSSAFDFQGDGRAEIVYADEVALRIYDGVDGKVLFETAHSSVTGYELPVIADLDADGHAEIIVVDNDVYTGAHTGVRVFEAEDDNWASARRLWHQHAYDITGVDDDLRVVTNPTPAWLLHNTFRSQRAALDARVYLPVVARN